MLTDEEKEAIEKLSGKKNETTWDDTIRQIKREEIKDVVVTRQKYITAVLKVIEKQSKEIEKYRNVIDNREFTWKQKYEETFEYVKENFINQDKIKEILGIEEDINNEKLLSLLQTIVDENARLEDIEDRKVQIEYNNVFNKV